MIGNPLKHRVAEEQISRLVRMPVRKIGLYEAPFGQPLMGLPQHVGRRVHADHFGARIARDQELRGIARPAAEIDHSARVMQRHLRQQIARRTGALVLEFQVLPGAPIGHEISARISCT
jgi:hypothetical protein